MYDFVDEKLNKKPVPAGDMPAGDDAGGAVVDPVKGLHPETRHTSELSMDLHGKSHPDALYRAAGGDLMEFEEGQMLYGCPCCGRTVGRVLRVRATPKAAWMAVCAMCAASTLDRNPEALIGGVVRAGRRRRRRGLKEAG